MRRLLLAALAAAALSLAGARPAAAQCATTDTVAASGATHTTLSAAAAAIPASLAGNHCVLIMDTRVYGEQVHIGNFASNGFMVYFGTVTAGARPTVRPPALSTAAFVLANTSVTIVGVNVEIVSPIPYGILMSSTNVSISSVSVSTSGPMSIYTAGVMLSSFSSISNSSVTGSNLGHAVNGTNVTAARVEFSTITSVASTSQALFLQNTLDVEVADSYIHNANHSAVVMNQSDDGYFTNSVIRNGSVAATVNMNFSDGNLFETTNFISDGNGSALQMSSESNDNQFDSCEFRTAATLSETVDHQSSHGNTFSLSYVENTSGSALRSVSGGYGLTINQSTVQANSGTVDGMLIQSTGTVIRDSYVQNSGAMSAVRIATGQVTLDQVQLYANVNTGAGALAVDGGAGIVVEDSLLRAFFGHALKVQGSAQLTVARSTMVSTANFSTMTVRLNIASATAIVDSYIQGPRAIETIHSTNVSIGNTVLVGTGTLSLVAAFQQGFNLTLTSSTFVSPDRQGVGVSAGGMRGLLMIATNTIDAGDMGIRLTTSAPNLQTWVTSNTVVAQAFPNRNTAGIIIDGLQSGATIQNNGVFYRRAGFATGGTNFTNALLLKTAHGIVVERNRFSNPGLLAAGSNLELVKLADADNVLFRYNDLYSTATAGSLINAYLLKLENSSGTQLSGNIFSSSYTASGSSATLSVDGPSFLGFTSNYNAFFSSNSAFGLQAGVNFHSLASWRAATAQDNNSLQANPLWVNPESGREDFHPRSFAGRWSGVTFVNDPVSSPTIDAGDPATAVGAEVPPNGARINQGSYAGTAEASKSGAPVAGCPNVVSVGAGYLFTDIQSAWDSLSPGPGGNTCIVIEDAATYNEAVLLANMDLTAGSVTVMGRGLTGRPRVSPPPGQVAAFQVRNTSVAIRGIDVFINNTAGYGIIASSGWVTISSVNVTTSPTAGVITAGISLSSWSTVSYSNVDVGNAPAMRFESSAQRSEVANSTFTSASTIASVYFAGASSNTVSQSRVANTGGAGLLIALGSHYNVVSQSSITTTANPYEGVFIGGSSSNTLQGSYVNSFIGPAVRITAGANNNVVSGSTVTGGSQGINIDGGTMNQVLDSRAVGLVLPGLQVTGSAHHTRVERSSFTGAFAAVNIAQVSSTTLLRVNGFGSDRGLRIVTDAAYTSVSLSSFNTQAFPALTIETSTGNVIASSYFTSVTTDAAKLYSGATNNLIANSTFVVANVTLHALRLQGASSNTISGVYANGGGGFGVTLEQGAHSNVVSGSTLASSGGGWPLYVTNAGSNTVTGSLISNPNGTGARLAQSPWITLTQSTVTGGFAAFANVFATGLSSAAFSFLSMPGCGDTCIQLNDSSNSSVTGSSLTAAGVTMRLFNSSWSTVTDTYLFSANNTALRLEGGSAFNAVSQSTIAANNMASDALFVTASASNTFVGVRVQNPLGRAAVFSASDYSRVFGSSVVGRDNEGLRVDSSIGVWVIGSYVQGSTALYVSNSMHTFLHNGLYAGVTGPSGPGCALTLQSSSNTHVSSNTLNSNGDGACALNGNQGPLRIASNTISARGAGVHIFDQNPNSPQVSVSSNSIRPLPGFATVNGVYLDALSAGATVENNSIYFRTSGGLAGTVSRGFYARNSSNWVFRRNRVNMPNTLTAGGFRGLELDNSSGGIENNDVHAVSLGAVLDSVELVRIGAGGSPVIKGNIFSSSATASVAASTHAINATGGGIISNYNVFHSSNGGLSFMWAAIQRHGLPQWITATFGQDAGSTEGHPLWASVVNFAEDFHPKSTAGRYDPSVPGFVNDLNADSASIDAADPAAPYADEPAPNGFHANAGSTGGTAEASKSPTGVCAVVRKVCKTGGCPYTSIQAAVNSIPNPLVGHSCVFIRDTSSYGESVTIASFTLAGSSIALAVDRSVSTGAVIQPPSPGGAILDIRVASVTVTGPLELRTMAAMNRDYGVYVASPSVRVSSVSVFETSGQFNVAGVFLSTESFLSYSTIVVNGNSVSALVATGPHITVAYASASWNGGVGGAPALLYMSGASSSTLTEVRFTATGSKDAAKFERSANVTVDRATFTTSAKALDLSDVSSFTLLGSVIVGGNQAVTVSSLSVGVLIDRSSIAASPAGAMPGVYVAGRDFTLSRARVSVGGGGAGNDAVQLFGAVSARFTDVSVAAGGNTFGFTLDRSSSTVIEQSIVQVANAPALRTTNGGPYTSVSFSTFTSAPAAATPVMHIQTATNTSISDAYIANYGNGTGLQFSNTSSNTVTRATVTASVGGSGALWLDSLATHNLFTDLTVSATNSTALRFEGGSSDNVVRRAVVTAHGTGSALYVAAPRGDYSSMTVVAYGNAAAYFDGSSDLSNVSYSSFSARGGNQVGLWLNGSSSGTLTGLYVAAINGTGLYLQNEASFNTISFSTVVGGSSASPAFDVDTSSVNLFHGGVVLSTGGAAAVRFGALSAFNTVDASRLTASRNTTQAVEFQAGAAGARLTNSRVVSDRDGVWVQAPDAAVTFSSVTASGLGLFINGTAVDVSTSYVLASTAVAVSFSDMPRVRGSVLVSSRTGGAALTLVNATNAVVSTNTFFGPAGGDGVSLANGQGRTVISSNTFARGPARQLAVSPLNVGAELWVSTNVFYPSIDGSSSTYGLHLSNLNTGATIQNNDIRYDSLGSIGTGFVAYGFYASGSTGLLVERNRFANLTDVTALGGLAPFVFVNSGQVTFRYNDVWSEEASNTVREMIAFHNTPNVTLTGNVFSNGATLPVGNSVIVNVVDNGASFRSDYNDFHLSVTPARVGRWNNGTPLSLAAWQSASGGDANSISADPLWFSTAAVFDFHPKSVGGRFNSAGSLFFDTVSAPTIDRGDPFDAIGAETFPGNNRVNMGSYAQTAQASRAAPPVGCSREITVPGSHATVQDAINQLDGEGLLADDPCIVVRSSPITEADLVVSGIDANNHRVTIMGEPGVDIALDLGSSLDAGFLIDNDSITVKGLRFFTSTPLDNMIRSRGMAVQLTSITVQSLNLLRTGVSISSGSSLSYSSVTSNGVAVQLSGIGASVTYTTAATTALSSAALRLDGTQGASVTGVYAQGNLSAAAVLAGGALNSAVSGSTFTSQGPAVFHVLAASRTAVTGSFVRAPNGAALRFEGGSYANIVSTSVLASTSPLSAAVQFSGGVNNTVQLSWIEQSAATTAVSMSGGARLNALSSMTILGSVAGTPLVDVVNASSNTFAALTVTNDNGPAMRLGGGASYNQVDQSTITSSLSAATVALDIINSTGNVVRRSYMEGANNALRVQATANRTRVELSTMAAQNDAALDIQFSSYVAVSRSMVLSIVGNRAMLVDGAHHTSVDLSTVSNPAAAGVPAIEFFSGKGNTVRGSYAEGGRGVYFGNGETNASVLYSEVHARAPGETAVWFEGSGAGFTVSSSVIQSAGGGAGSAGIKALGLGGGQVAITSNTVLSGARYGILVGTQAATGRVHVASNTVFPTLSTMDTYGIMLEGVRSGATVQNNSVYYRDPGPQSGGVSIGIYSYDSDGVLIERNRVSQPGVIDPGGSGSIGIGINATPRALVRFNDSYVAGDGYGFAAAFAAQQSTGIVLTNNALSSWLTGGSTRTLDTDLVSANGLRLGYNLYHSSSGPVEFYRNGTPFSYPFNFVGVPDPDPVSHTPHWFSVVPGAEDFHPRSHAGRWDPVLNAYVFSDQWTSAMVDRGDTAESFALEPPDNGGRVNIGSYGGTVQASLTPPGATGPAVTSVTDDLIEVSFSDSGSPNGHIVGASTTPAFTGVTLSSSGPQGELSLAPSGLDPNATYYLLTGAVWGDAVVFAGFITTVTRAEAPTAASPAFPEVFKTSASVRWNTAGNPLNVTTYTVTFTTSTPFPNASAGNRTVARLADASPSSATVTGLAPNTTYQAFVAALNHAGVASSYLQYSTATRAETPSGSNVSGVQDTYTTVFWAANGNPLVISTYVVQVSTASDFNFGASSVTLTTAPAAGPSATLTGLTPATTYFLRVAARSHDGELTPFDPAGFFIMFPLIINPPSGASFTAGSSVTLSGNWGLSPSATGYTMVVSTEGVNPPVAVTASSTTVGQGNTNASVGGLTPNTTYFAFVRANGNNGNSLYTVFGATHTQPALPLTAVTTFTAVEATSFTVTWLANGNPLAMTTYTVVASTAANFNAGASSVTLSTVPAFGPTASLTGLTPYAVWHVQVRALGHGTGATPFVSLGSTQTLPVPLDPPASVQPQGVSMSSAAASWSLVLGATGYSLVAAPDPTNPPAAPIWVSSVAGGATSAGSVFGLSPLSTFYLLVRAEGPGNSGPWTVSAATATNPVPPAGAVPPFSIVASALLSHDFTIAANPVGIATYTVTLSTVAAFPNSAAGNQNQTLVPAGTSGNASFGGLSPNTTYHFFTRAFSHAGVPFGAVTGSTSTDANAPSAFVPDPILANGISSVTVRWQTNGNPAITSYTVVASTASNFNAFAASVTFTTASVTGVATVSGLSFGTSWYFQVRAVSHSGAATGFANLGSTYTYLSQLIPLIVDNQAGDVVWRRANTGVYDVDFQDGSGVPPFLDRVQVSVSTNPGGAGDLVAFTDAVTGIGSAVYTFPIVLPAGVFSAMLEGATNYVTVSVYNQVSSNTLTDVFYVLKDTTAPTFVNNELGGDLTVQTAAGRAYDVRARDAASGLDAFQYSVSATPGTPDESVIAWTDIAPLSGATEYATPWTVNFAALRDGATNYVSLRAWDIAGSTSTVLVDAFKVFKDTTGPAVAISSPNVATTFVSTASPVLGGVSGPFGVSGASVAVQDVGTGLYWNGATFLSATPVWIAATGVSSWTVANLGVPFANGQGYRIIARGSTPYGLFSTRLATATFTFDDVAPTVGVTSPTALAVVASIPSLSGTAADATAGLSLTEVRLKRFSDGLWWNWFTEAWSAAPISTGSAAGAVWSVAPSALLQANMQSGSSYYIAVRASDNATPPNAGDFFTSGSTFTFSNPTPPAAITDLAAVNGTLPGDVRLTWTARGAHGADGVTLVGQYAIFASTDSGAVPSTAAAQVIIPTATVVPGQFQGFIGGNGTLTPGVTYFLYVAMSNYDGNWSAFSNQASTTALPAPSNSITGHVVNASTQGITAVRIDAFDATGVLINTAFTVADGSGTYSVSGLAAGNYKIEASWTANGITSSAWIDGIPMGSVNIDFSLDINYALATLTGTLGALSSSGQAGLGVAGSGHRPSAAGSHVELHQGGREVARVNPDPTGRWTIGHLLPGSYAVRAYTGLGYTDFVDIDLAEGEIRTVGFVFNPLPDASVFAFPNPARHSTTIRFETALQPLEAQIAIFDLKGSLVREVPGNRIAATATPGLYHYVWDLTNSRGEPVASGVYLFMVKVKGGSENQLVKVIKKLAVVR